MDEKQMLINQIATLSATIKPLFKSEKKDAVDAVVAKILELINKL